MSDPIDEKGLDEYLRGGSALSQRYRDLGEDSVPPELDRRVLEQAREAVAKRAGTSRAWRKWTPPLALAASAVLVFSIVMRSGVQQDLSQVQSPAPTDSAAAQAEIAADEKVSSFNMPLEAEQAPAPEATMERMRESPQPVPFAPEAPAAPPSADASSGADLMQDRIRNEAADVSAKLESEVRRAAPPPATALPQLAGEAQKAIQEDVASRSGDDLDSVTVTSARRPAEETSASAIATETALTISQTYGEQLESAPAAASPSTAGPRETIVSGNLHARRIEEDKRAVQPYESVPEQWLERIRQLRKDGKSDEADREWLRFRKAFPDHPVAESDTAPQRPSR